MGTAFGSTPYATVANPCTIEFIRDWVPGILAYRAAELDTTGWTTIVIQQGSGSPSTETEPEVHYASTVAELQTIITDHASVATAGLIVAIQAGTVWQCLSESAVTLARANICLTKYGEGNNPLFHGTATLAELGATTMGSPTGGVYTITLGSAPMSGKVFSHMLEDWGSTPRNAMDTARTYRWKTTSGGVTAAGDFHYNSGTRVLTLYPHASATIATNAFRVVVHSGTTFTGSMIRMRNYNKVIVRDIDVIGTGGDPTLENDQLWAFISEAGSTNAHGLFGCMGIYNYFHNAGLYNTGTAGGIMLVEDCDLGLCKYYDSIPLVFYSFNGVQEGYTNGNRILRFLANDNHSTVRQRSVQPIYAHTNGGGVVSTIMVWSGDTCWGGQWGYGAIPYVGDAPNTANPDHGTLNMVDDARVFIVDCTMDGGDYATAKNAGNAPRILGAQSGHVYVNCLCHSYLWDRTTDTTTVEWFEISVTDYDYRGWFLNCIWEIDVGAVTGTHNFGLLRNNLGTGTEPDSAGAYESQMWNCTLYLVTPAGFDISGNWNCLSAQQNATHVISTGVSDDGPFRFSFYNSLIVNNSAANSTEDLVLGLPNADPDGPRYTTPTAGNTLRGGAQRTGFKGCRATDADKGDYRNLGTSYFTTSTACINLSNAYTNPRAFPAVTDEIVLSSATDLHASADGEILEYDHYGRTRPASGADRAIGAVEYYTPPSAAVAYGGELSSSIHVGL